MSLLDVDDREVGIRGKGIGGVGLPGVVIGDVGGAALLIGTQDQPGVGAHGESQLPDRLHGQEGADHGALVVGDSSAIEHPVPLHAGIGIGGPAGALAHHVQVAQDVQPGLLVVEVGKADIVVIVGDGKPQLLAEGQGLRKRGGGARAKGLAGFGLALHALNAHQPGDGGDQLLLPSRVVPICLDLFLIHNRFFLS